MENERATQEEDKSETGRIVDIISREIPIRNIEDLFLTVGSADLINSFRVLNSKGIDLSKKIEDVPEDYIPFLDGSLALRYGAEVEYHRKRVGIIETAASAAAKDPKVLKRYFEGIGIGICIIMGDNLSKEDRSLLGDQSSHIFKNVSNLNFLFTHRKFGLEKYVLGVDKSGTVYTKDALVLTDPREAISQSVITSAHASAFMNLPVEVLAKIVPDRKLWAFDYSENCKIAPDKRRVHIGMDMTKIGLENKRFYSPLPHEVLVGGDQIERITVIDNPPNSVLFCTHYDNDTISVGTITREGGTYGYISTDMFAAFTENYKGLYSCLTQPICLAGCIARDMFVCEEKDVYYKQAREEGRNRKGKRRADKDKIIWLPRFKTNYLNLPEREEQLVDIVTSLSPADVTGHIRRAENPDPAQLELARNAGVIIPSGYTYVRPHKRSGSGPFTRVYKSRSAMQMLYGRGSS